MSRRLNFHRFSCGLRRLVHISSMFKIILVPTECVHIENNKWKKQTLKIDNLIVGCTANHISSEEKIRISRIHNYAFSIRCLIVDWLHEAKRIVALNSSCFVFWCGVRDTSNYVSDIAFRTALPLLCFALLEPVIQNSMKLVVLYVYYIQSPIVCSVLTFAWNTTLTFTWKTDHCNSNYGKDENQLTQYEWDIQKKRMRELNVILNSLFEWVSPVVSWEKYHILHQREWFSMFFSLLHRVR